MSRKLSSRPSIAATSLRSFFQPKAVAVIGVSRDPRSIGQRLLEAMISGGFGGSIFPVNPKASEICGLRTFPMVADLPETPDMAVVAVPRDAVLGVVEECAVRGVRAVVVISAGFAEVGEEGKRLQELLLDKVRRNGMRLIGPNCFGLLSNGPTSRLNATFVPVSPPAGRVAMSSDSGALGLALLATAARLELGVSSCVSVGNRADVSSNDLLEYWEQDDSAGVILLYLESFGNPRRFARIARRVSRSKPIVAVKAGRTRAGFRAAGSHTAALVVRDAAVDALFHQCGVIRVETLEELFDLGATLANQPLPSGCRVGIVTNAGGPAILCADACEAAGLVLPELSAMTRRQLAAFLPANASLANPVDMIAAANADQYACALQTLRDSGEVDSLIAIHVAAGLAPTDDILKAICGAASAKYPVLACLMPEQASLKLLGSASAKIPCFAFPEAPAKALGKLAAYAQWRSQPEGSAPRFSDVDSLAARRICQGALKERGAGWLTSNETQRLLVAANLPAAGGGLATTADQAVAIFYKLNCPVALKLASRQAIHKTEVGGVHLDLANEAAVRRAFDAIRERQVGEGRLDFFEGALVQPMIRDATEVLIGVAQDPVFGPLVAFGLGGVHVEILEDVCFRATPLSDRDAAEMVRSIRGRRLLEGYRGHPAADLAALEETLLRVSQLVEEVPEITELDLNPVFALSPGEGCRIVDARLHVAPARQPARFESGGTSP